MQVFDAIIRIIKLRTYSNFSQAVDQDSEIVCGSVGIVNPVKSYIALRVSFGNYDRVRPVWIENSFKPRTGDVGIVTGATRNRIVARTAINDMITAALQVNI